MPTGICCTTSRAMPDTAHIPVIVLSNRDQRNLAQMVVECLVKPVDWETLRGLVERTLLE